MRGGHGRRDGYSECHPWEEHGGPAACPDDCADPPECTIAADCDDLDPCTDDACTDATCVHLASGDNGCPLACGDGECHPWEEDGGPAPCPDDCADAQECLFDSDCDDGDACTTDTCELGTCATVPAPDGTSCATSSPAACQTQLCWIGSCWDFDIAPYGTPGCCLGDTSHWCSDGSLGFTVCDNGCGWNGSDYYCGGDPSDPNTCVPSFN